MTYRVIYADPHLIEIGHEPWASVYRRIVEGLE